MAAFSVTMAGLNYCDKDPVSSKVFTCPLKKNFVRPGLEGPENKGAELIF